MSEEVYNCPLIVDEPIVVERSWMDAPEALVSTPT
jgi:hypothetical protein